MRDSKFDTIRCYYDDEIHNAIKKIAHDELFLKALDHLVGIENLETAKQQFLSVNTLTDSQEFFVKIFANRIIKYSIKDFIYNGIENYASAKPCVLVSNHRDIVLDSFLLQYALNDNDLANIRTAVGDNLLFNNLVKEFAKINKMFIVRRRGSLREKLMDSLLLSEYIRKSISEDHESLWIAQRNGRTKNGLDQTQPGLLKMLSASKRNNIIESLKELNILPMSISYEYESCDQLKAREICLSKTQEYIKGENEDLHSIQTGLFGYKGRVSLVISESINPFLDTIEPTLSDNEKLNLIARHIDQQIYKNYKLWKTNYIAFDIIENQNQFTDHYAKNDKDNFKNYIDKQASIGEVSFSEMKEMLLQIYANPVYTSLGLKTGSLQEDF